MLKVASRWAWRSWFAVSRSSIRERMLKVSRKSATMFSRGGFAVFDPREDAERLPRFQRSAGSVGFAVFDPREDAESQWPRAVPHPAFVSRSSIRERMLKGTWLVSLQTLIRGFAVFDPREDAESPQRSREAQTDRGFAVFDPREDAERGFAAQDADQRLKFRGLRSERGC